MATALAIRSLRLIGIVLLVTAPSIAIGDEVAIRRELRQIDDVWSRRTAPVDSAVISSEQYHHAHLVADAAARWSATGHATLGVIGTALGLALVLVSRRRTV